MIRLKGPIQGLQGALTDPWNLSHQGAEDAGNFYRDENSLNQPNPPSVLEQAVHQGQAGQAIDYADTQGFKGFMQAMKERGGVINPKSNLQLPPSPNSLPRTFDPRFQASAVEALKRL